MNDTKIIKFIEWLESEEDRFFAYAHKHLEKGEMTVHAISSAEASTYAKVRMVLQDLLSEEEYAKRYEVAAEKVNGKGNNE